MTATPTPTPTATFCYPASALAYYGFESSVECWHPSPGTLVHVTALASDPSEAAEGNRSLRASILNASGSTTIVQIQLDPAAPVDLSGKRLRAWVYIDASLVRSDSTSGVQAFAQSGPDWGSAVWESSWTTVNAFPELNVGEWVPVTLVFGTGPGTDASSVLQFGIELTNIPAGASGNLFVDGVSIEDVPTPTATSTPTLIVTATSTPTKSWKFIGDEGLLAGSEEFGSGAISLEIMGGVTILAYQNFNFVHVRQFDGTAWSAIGDGVPSTPTTLMSVGLCNGSPCFATRDFEGDLPTLFGYSMGNWSVVQVVPITGIGGDLSLAVEGGIPYIAYEDAGNGSRASVAYLDGNNFVVIGAPNFSMSWARSLSLDVEAGVPYVAYREAGTDNKATVMKYEGGAWQPVGGSPGFSPNGVLYISLEVSNGIPYVAFMDSLSARANVMKFDGTWTSVGAPNFSVMGSAWITLRMDGEIPYVAFVDNANGNRITVMKNNAGVWETVGSPGFTPGPVSFLSFKIHGGVPHVAFVDARPGMRYVSVMKYD